MSLIRTIRNNNINDTDINTKHVFFVIFPHSISLSLYLHSTFSSRMQLKCFTKQSKEDKQNIKEIKRMNAPMKNN